MRPVLYHCAAVAVIDLKSESFNSKGETVTIFAARKLVIIPSISFKSEFPHVDSEVAAFTKGLPFESRWLQYLTA